MLYWANIILLIECVIFYLKWIVVIVIVIAVVTYWSIHHSLSKQANKKPLKIRNILLGIGTLKLKRAYYEPDDIWPIWWWDFQPTQSIIRLPWNEKHYFHDGCIGEWISKNPCWPLCKAKITEELLKAWAENTGVNENNGDNNEFEPQYINAMRN